MVFLHFQGDIGHRNGTLVWYGLIITVKIKRDKIFKNGESFLKVALHKFYFNETSYKLQALGMNLLDKIFSC